MTSVTDEPLEQRPPAVQRVRILYQFAGAQLVAKHHLADMKRQMPGGVAAEGRHERLDAGVEGVGVLGVIDAVPHPDAAPGVDLFHDPLALPGPAPIDCSAVGAKDRVGRQGRVEDRFEGRELGSASAGRRSPHGDLTRLAPGSASATIPAGASVSSGRSLAIGVAAAPALSP